MTRLNRLTDAVREILLVHWDPIGIQDVPQAQDEYDAYLPPLARMIIDGASVAEISHYLLQVEADMLNRKGNPERARRVAERLLNVA